ncbi:hypothetical protein Tdes44962_MAKER05325 [Teratosphaeria destructans]|uniref:Uncharacterized protein n=1 Tax=Teratosphaeria destructans TaxID=418781 RepID=A0A9W7SK17_9PEZI|nr:hypothetical protein Tdes44962_MAKER05325 [Teratosphaeria destructans]
MFATRNHNENAIYEQQTAAASKPLNQGVKGLAPKTPAKTPFKGRQNDENAALLGANTIGKAGKAAVTAFQTPAGPKNRAPLGNKTTNAKALQTPAPPTQEKPLSNRPTSPRLRRGKVKIHQAEVDPLEDDNGEREIEYMPPRGEPLPDLPDDGWPVDRQYSQFEGTNLTKGWWSEYQPHKDPEEFSDFEEKLKEVEARERKKKKTLTAASTDSDKERKPSTLNSRNAASALANAPKGTTKPKASLPSFAVPTAAAKARLPSALASRKPISTASAPRNSRHTAAKVASNTTLGYSKGRAVSGAARKPLSTIHMDSVEQADQMSPKNPAFATSLFGSDSLVVDDDALGGTTPAAFDAEDDLLADFQLASIGD